GFASAEKTSAEILETAHSSPSTNNDDEAHVDTVIAPAANSLFAASPHAAPAPVTATGATSTAPSMGVEAAEGAAPEIQSSALDAVEAVDEVVELTHAFRARERSSVEVKFHFSDD